MIFSGAISSGAWANDGQGGLSFTIGNIGSLTIEGNLEAGTKEGTGTLANSGSIQAVGSIGKIKIGGSIIGNETNLAIIGATVSSTSSVMNNITLKDLSVGEDVKYAVIGVGTINTEDSPLYGIAPFARIGKVSVGGDWTASSLIAGADPSLTSIGPDGYGNDDVPSFNWFASETFNKFGLSKISSVTIGGVVAGGTGDAQYGFVAQSFGKITVQGVAQTIPAVGSKTDLTEDGNVTIHTITKDRPAPPTGT